MATLNKSLAARASIRDGLQGANRSDTRRYRADSQRRRPPEFEDARAARDLFSVALCSGNRTAHHVRAEVRHIMDCTVRWMPESGMGFIAETGSGHFLAMDGAPDGGGRNLAPRPMEALLAGTGGCTAYDVVLILKRGRHAVTGCQVKLSAERATQDPKIFTRIAMHFVVSGRDLPPAAVGRAVALSHERYCSASAMLAKSAEINTSFEIVQA
jgi:putative redox protein